MENQPTLGTLLRTARTARGVTLRQMGAATGIHWTNLGQMERGATVPTAARLRTICGYLGIEEETAIRAYYAAKLSRDAA